MINSGSGHTHKNLQDLNRIGVTEDGYITLDQTTEDTDGNIVESVSKAKAGYADMAGNLDQDSTDWNKILRKDKDDYTEHLVDFRGGIKVGESSFDKDGVADIVKAVTNIIESKIFSSGLIGGTGYSAWVDSNGKSHFESDYLTTRIKAIFAELEIRKVSYLGGNFVFSSAGSKICRVVPIANGWRCYMIADDGSTRTENWWKVGDQARCQTFNIKPGIYQNVSNKYYWRLVTGIGSELLEDGKTYDYVDLSNQNITNVQDKQGNYCIGYDPDNDNDEPGAGDSIVQMGSQIESERQHIFMIVVTGNEAPALMEYTGVNSYSLVGHRVMILSPKGNKVVSSSFEIVSNADVNVTAPITCNRGEFDPFQSYGYYDVVSYNGSLWLCIVAKGSVTSEVPSDSSSVWQKQIAKGDAGKDGLSLTPLGHWSTGLVVSHGTGGKLPVGSVVQMGSASYACTVETANLPLWCYTDNGNRLTLDGTYYLLTGSENTAEWVRVASDGVAGKDGAKGPTGPQGEKGERGEDGTGVNIRGSYDTVSQLQTAHPTGVAGDAYMVDKDLYVWNVEKNTWHNCGRIKGEDGISSYFHVKYSDDGGTTFTGNNGEDVGSYIGTYVDFKENDSANVGDYKWQQFEGAQGPQGEKGIAGKNGSDGRTSYLHIKYSNDGSTFTKNNGEDSGDWIGLYTDFTESDSAVFERYKWRKTKGKTGEIGPQGPSGKDGNSVSNLGHWTAGMEVTYLGIVQMGDASYVARKTTKNPPLWVYTDKDGNPYYFQEPGDETHYYFLTGEKNSEEFDMITRNGADALSMYLSPASILIQQSTVKNSDGTFPMIYDNAYADVMCYNGNTPVIPDSISVTSSDSTQRVAWKLTGQRITITALKTYTRDGLTYYYDAAVLKVTVTYNGISSVIYLKIYANLLGTIYTTIIGDVSSTFASKKEYDTLSKRVTDNHAEFIQSSTEQSSNIAAVQKRMSEDETVINMNSSLIRQTANDIASKVSKTDYNNDQNAIKSRMTAAESEIHQAANDIALKVSKTDYDLNNATVDKAIRKNAAAVELNANNISLKVSQIDYDDDQTALSETGIDIKKKKIALNARKTEIKDGEQKIATFTAEGFALYGANMAYSSNGVLLSSYNRYGCGEMIAYGPGISWRKLEIGGWTYYYDMSGNLKKIVNCDGDVVDMNGSYWFFIQQAKIDSSVSYVTGVYATKDGGIHCCNLDLYAVYHAGSSAANAAYDGLTVKGPVMNDEPEVYVHSGYITDGKYIRINISDSVIVINGVTYDAYEQVQYVYSGGHNTTQSTVKTRKTLVIINSLEILEN